MSIPLSQETFYKLRGFIYTKSGLSFPDGKKYLLECRLTPRLNAVHCPTFEDYLSYIQFDPGRDKELIQLLNCVTTNETFFFRDITQMDCFRQVILPQVIKARQNARAIRIWSAGCSSGEEPFTLAMILAEEFSSVMNWDVQILATDLSDHVLQAAGKGVYGPYAVRNIPPAYLQKYFTATEGQYLVGPTLRKYVKFSRLNLFDALQMRSMKNIDVILCRNVLIYFDQEVRKKIVSNFFDALRPSGSLIIGFSESLSGVNRLFRPIPWHKTFFYAKADEGLPSTLEPGVGRALSSSSPPPQHHHVVGAHYSSASGLPAPMQPLATRSLSASSAHSPTGNQSEEWKLKGKAP